MHLFAYVWCNHTFRSTTKGISHKYFVMIYLILYNILKVSLSNFCLLVVIHELTCGHHVGDFSGLEPTSQT